MTTCGRFCANSNRTVWTASSRSSSATRAVSSVTCAASALVVAATLTTVVGTMPWRRQPALERVLTTVTTSPWRVLATGEAGGALLEGRDPLADYETVRGELAAYGAGLDARPELVVLNKVDLVSERDPLKGVADALRARGRQVFFVSGATGEGVAELLTALGRALEAEDAR